MQRLWRWITSFEWLLPCLLPVGLAAVATFSVCVYCLLYDVQFRNFSQDPAAYHYYPAFDGVLSHLSVLFWGAAGSLGLFGAWLLWRTGAVPAVSRCFLFGGLISLTLWVDDLFLLHERVLPEAAGIPEKLALGFLGTSILVWLAWYRRVLFARSWGLLLAAMGLFGACILLDLLWPFDTLMFLLEDSAKLFGGAIWVGYFGAAVAGHLAAVPTAVSPAADRVGRRPTAHQEPEYASAQ